MSSWEWLRYPLQRCVPMSEAEYSALVGKRARRELERERREQDRKERVVQLCREIGAGHGVYTRIARKTGVDRHVVSKVCRGVEA